MLIKVFSVHDSKAEAFLPPFFCQTTGIATRTFEQAANDESHNFRIHSGDYTLFELGVFDDSSGQIEMLATPLNLGLAITYIQTEQ